MSVERERVLDLMRLAYRGIPFKRTVFKLLRRIYIPPKSIWQHLYFKGRFDVDFAGGCLQMLNNDQSLETSVFWAGLDGYEKSSMRLWAMLVLRSSVVLDIGANTGLYSLVAKALNPAARVYSFEPIDRFREKLVRNSQLNSFDIKAEGLAVSNQDGEAVIYDLPFAHHYHASLIENEAGRASRNLVKQKTRTMRLDTFISNEKLNGIDLVKIDVEGYEPEVLEGMGECLGRMQPTILVEIKRLDQARRIQALLADLDYCYFDIDEERGPRQVDTLGPSSGYNFLICTGLTASRLSPWA